MCGIAGILNINDKPVSPAILRKMTDAIVHRGPDGEGLFTEDNIGLGHRRLAIIDLSQSGNQPMQTANGRYIITYNGETYNFLQLRTELESLGHKFHSRTDTEVVLYAFEEWGTECVKRFNGMFAFAIWDRKLKQLFIARDRYGIKPLYYTFIKDSFLFASEQKALIKHPRFRREIDLEALLEYFTFQNIFTNRTLLKNVRVFPPGCWTYISSKALENDFRPIRYWDFHFVEPENPLQDNEYEEELDRLFRQAVCRQLISDVEIGAYLSGGMDSGSITAIAASQLPYIKSFTCGFDLHSASGLELLFDEREKAEHMSYLFRTEHYEMVLKSGDMERILPPLAWHIEEPRIGQSYPNFYAAQLASKFVKVVLAGTGGDEIFGGYPWRYYRAATSDSFEDFIDKYYVYWQRLIPNTIIKRVFKPIWKYVKHMWTRDIFMGIFAKHSDTLTRPEDYINHSLYFEAKTFLHGLLIIEDKLSMAHSLETRVPFLDNELVDFAMNIPVHLKLRNISEIIALNENEPGPKTARYYEKTRDGKILLRRVMERYIPETITNGAKQGFSAPDASWFRGESIDYIKKILYNRDTLIYNFLDKASLLRLVDEHIEGKQNRRLLIWSLLNFEHWCRSYL